MSINELQDEVIAEFSDFDDWMDRYQLLIDLGNEQEPLEEKYKTEVLSHFFKFGKLTQIPTQRKKREIVLAEIAKSFEAGRHYSENEVNEIIHRFHDDHCTIRREMIACGIMTRENEIYWLK